MNLFTKKLEQIDEAELSALIEAQVPESRLLEYKRDAPGNSDEAKREFLADVSSFANAEGGDIIYGIEEAEGLPTKVVGLTGSAEELKLRLEQLVTRGLDLRLPVLPKMSSVMLSNNSFVLIIRIAKSWEAPHMVTAGGDYRFWIRGDKRKDRLDATELKRIVLNRISIRESIEQRRTVRLSRIISGETPFVIPSTSYAVIQLIYAENSALKGLIQDLHNAPFMRPLGASQYNNPKANYDGAYSVSSGGSYLSYVQLHRNGDCDFVSNEFMERNDTFALARLLGHTYEYMRQNVIALAQRGAVAPLGLGISLVGVNSRDVIYAKGYVSAKGRFDRDIITLPMIWIERDDEDWADLLEQANEQLWQSAGVMTPPYTMEDVRKTRDSMKSTA
jgi:hypothetical protein